MSSVKKKKSSPDYPRLAKAFLQTSEDEVISKLPAALYVVATPIGHMGDISLRALITLSEIDAVACEDTRLTGMLMNAFGLKKELISCHDHNETERIPLILDRIQKGQAIALVSDAGLPLIADPGFKVVQACCGANLPVTVIPGANAALTALAGSGLPTDTFYFAGFLPPKTLARQKALTALKTVPATLIFYESPQRLSDTLEDLAEIMGQNRRATVARELTKLHEETRRGSLKELVQYFQAHPPKGEIVILIEASAEQANMASDHDLETLLRDALQSKSLRDAVAAVSELTGRKKNEVYARALWLTRNALTKEAGAGE